MTDIMTGMIPSTETAGDRFRARILSSEVEARPLSAPLTPPGRLNPAARKACYFYLMAPAIALYPFFWLIVMAFQKGDMGAVEWVGFKNFTDLASDGRFLSGWVLLFKYSAMCLFLRWATGCCWH